MNFLSPGLLLVLGLLKIASGAESSASGTVEESKRAYMDVLVSQGRVNDLKRREENAKELLANITSEHSQLQKNLETCNSEDGDPKNIETLEVIQNRISNENEQLEAADIEGELLRSQINNITERILFSQRHEDYLITIVRNLTEEGDRLRKEMEDAERKYVQFNASDFKPDETEHLRKERNEAILTYTEHSENLSRTEELLKNEKILIENLSEERDKLIKKQDELGDRIGAALGRLKMLRDHETERKKQREMEISQRKEKCEWMRTEYETKIIEKEKEMRNAQNVVRMREANRMWIEKEVSEKRKKLDDLLWKKQQEEKRKGEEGRVENKENNQTTPVV